MEISPSATSTAASPATNEGFGTDDMMNDARNKTKRLLFLGAPGCGKGTQSSVITAEYKITHLATGDMLRSAVANKTAPGLKAKEAMDRGELVSDDIVLALLEEKIISPECQNGFLLDGFPRNLTQGAVVSSQINSLIQLDAILRKMDASLDAVIFFNIPDEALTERIVGRRIHPSSGRVYHIKFNPPRIHDLDDITGESLCHRKDDTKETLSKRLSIFHKETKPLVEYYKQQGKLYEVDATLPAHRVSELIKKFIDSTTKL